MGLPVREIRQRVAALPADSAVFYFGINADPERTYATAVEALPLIAETSNRPIVGDGETGVGAGAIGGYVLSLWNNPPPALLRDRLIPCFASES